MIVAGNWKMFDGPDPRALADRLRGVPGVDAVVVPPYTRLAASVEAGLVTYAQNVHWEAEGAFTGEVSAPMLLALGVRGAIIGHSERRQYFCETDTGVARRAQAALDAGLAVIACVGETREERDAGATETVLRVQVQAIGDACGPHDLLVLAYEPVWAIGTGVVASTEEVAEASTRKAPFRSGDFRKWRASWSAGRRSPRSRSGPSRRPWNPSQRPPPPHIDPQGGAW